MLIKSFYYLTLILLLNGCTTIAGMDLPVTEAPIVSEKIRKSVRLIFDYSEIDEKDRSRIFEGFKKTQVFREVHLEFPIVIEKPEKANAVIDFFPISDTGKAHVDLQLKLRYVPWRGEVHPYCYVFLTVIPCMVPLDTAISAQLSSKDGIVLQNYYISDAATEVTWAFGFLFPGADYPQMKKDFFLQNMINHIVIAMKKDGFI